MDETQILAVASTQGGVIRRDQAVAAGLSSSAIDRRIRAGYWTRVHAGVYRVFPARSHRDLLAGALAALPTAVVSHSSAARLHELDGLPDGLPTVTVHASKAYRFPDVDVRRTRTLIDEHTVEVDGLSTTTVARTLVDLAADLRPSRWQHLAERVVVHGVCTLDDVRAVAEVACGRGVAGSKLVRAFLEDPLAGTSRLERLAIEALRLAGLPRPELQYPIPWDPGKRFDLAYPRARLAIELDGRRWHSEREVFQTDRRRDREALVRGWIVPRFTFDDVAKRPEQFVRTTAELLAERSVD